MVDEKISNDYIQSQKKVLSYVRKQRIPPLEVQIEAVNNLVILRKHLDDKGIRMPMPKYLYNPHDKTTWRYIYFTKTKHTDSKQTSLNPLFKYNDI